MKSKSQHRKARTCLFPFNLTSGSGTITGKHFDHQRVIQAVHRFSFRWLNKTEIRELVADQGGSPLFD